MGAAASRLIVLHCNCFSEGVHGCTFALIRLLNLPFLGEQVHEGFLEAYDSVHQKVLCVVDEVVADDCGEPWWVMVTGHSLGGALATLCAYELTARR